MESEPLLLIQKLNENAKIPSRGSKDAVGYDLFALEDTAVNSGNAIISPQFKVRTGIAISIPKGYYGRIAPRSGLAVRKGITTLGGVIDPDFRGEIIVLLVSFCEHRFIVEKGDAIAQLIIEKCITPEIQIVKSLDETERGIKGFGSTDQKLCSKLDINDLEI